MRGHRLAAPLLLTLAVTGCSATPVAAPTATRELPPPLSNGATASAPASPPAQPTSTAPASAAPPARGDATAGIPAAARAHTPEGAEAFVRYFVDQINVAWTTPRTGLISSLSLPSCKSCADLEKGSAEMVSTNSKYAQALLTISVADVVKDPDGTTVVEGSVREAPVPYVRQGTSQAPASAEISPRAFLLAETPSGWKISEIKILR